LIGLLADSTSIQIDRPVGRYQEAKSYFDAKNQIYALKKEIVVMTSPPHYALFSAPAQEGSKHDYTIHKEIFGTYLDDLQKTREEKAMIFSDSKNASWAIFLDIRGLHSTRPISTWILDIMILLTNENIWAYHPLAEEERDFYKRCLQRRVQIAKQRAEKVERARTRYRESRSALRRVREVFHEISAKF
jgi:hypothetical protein